MNVPLLAGRVFSEQDVLGKAKVAVINLTVAKRYFGTPQNAIGRTISFDPRPEGKFDTEIIGVVGDTKHHSVRDPVRMTVYRSVLQSPELNGITYLVRTWRQPADAEAGIRSAMQQIDSKLALSNLQTEDEQIDNSLSNERLIAMLSSSFGVIAVLLAAIGLYGVLAFSTAQRTREIGIRMAMGAQRSAVVKMVLQDVLWICGVSIAVSLPLALLLGRLLRTQLYGRRRSRDVTGRNASDCRRRLAGRHDSCPPRRIRRTDAGFAYRVGQRPHQRRRRSLPKLCSRISCLPGTSSWAKLSCLAYARRAHRGALALRL
jgi:putative ABC transport system permease protein